MLTGYSSTPCESVTLLYGARSDAVPRGGPVGSRSAARRPLSEHDREWLRAVQEEGSVGVVGGHGGARRGREDRERHGDAGCRYGPSSHRDPLSRTTPRSLALLVRRA